jgi:hypothetical protein
MFDLVVIKKLPKYLRKWRTNPAQVCIVIHNSTRLVTKQRKQSKWKFTTLSAAHRIKLHA